MAKFCTNCGAEIKEGARFCETCGQQLPVATEQRSAEEQSSQAAQPVVMEPIAPTPNIQQEATSQGSAAMETSSSIDAQPLADSASLADTQPLADSAPVGDAQPSATPSSLADAQPVQETSPVVTEPIATPTNMQQEAVSQESAVASPAPQQIPPQTPNTPEAQDKKKSKLPLFLGIAVVVIIGIVFAISMLGGKPADLTPTSTDSSETLRGRYALTYMELDGVEMDITGSYASWFIEFMDGASCEIFIMDETVKESYSVIGKVITFSPGEMLRQGTIGEGLIHIEEDGMKLTFERAIGRQGAANTGGTTQSSTTSGDSIDIAAYMGHWEAYITNGTELIWIYEFDADGSYFHGGGWPQGEFFAGERGTFTIIEDDENMVVFRFRDIAVFFGGEPTVHEPGEVDVLFYKGDDTLYCDEDNLTYTRGDSNPSASAAGASGATDANPADLYAYIIVTMSGEVGDYAFYDIDGNGTPEMILRYETPMENYVNIYSYVDGSIVLIGEFWSRSRLVSIGTHGRIYRSGSNGAAHSVYEASQIADDNRSLVVIERWEADYDTDLFLHDFGGIQRTISEQAFNEVASMLESDAGILANLSWQYIPTDTEGGGADWDRGDWIDLGFISIPPDWDFDSYDAEDGDVYILRGQGPGGDFVMHVLNMFDMPLEELLAECPAWQSMRFNNGSEGYLLEFEDFLAWVHADSWWGGLQLWHDGDLSLYNDNKDIIDAVAGTLMK